VAKPELGTKRLCGSCGAKFYDLSKDPIVCPKCETVFHPVVYTSTRGRPAEARAPVAPLVPEAAEAPEAADVEMVSLEDADAESGGGAKKQAAGDVDVDEDEVEVADDGAEDDTFLEPEDDEGDDVSDIVGGDREDEEDT
jgi:uncharacterized protein (TIGR02300 family)